jgi:hypothetical protein
MSTRRPSSSERAWAICPTRWAGRGGADAAQSGAHEAQPAAATSGTASATSAADAAAAPKRAYPAPAEVPTQQGPKGIQFDFNDGCRVVLPEADKP